MKITPKIRVAVANLIAADIVVACNTEEELVAYLDENGSDLMDAITIEIARQVAEILGTQYAAKRHVVIVSRWIDHNTGKFALTEDALSELMKEAGV